MILALLSTFFVTSALPAQSYTFAIEINGVLCGYAEVETTRAGDPGGEFDLVNERVFAQLSALGSSFDLEIESAYHVDPETGRCTYQDTRIEQGEVVLASRIFLEGAKARIVYPIEKEEKELELPEGAILDNPIRSPHLVRDFIIGGSKSMTYPVISVLEAEVHPTRFVRVRRESLELAGKAHETLVLDSVDEVTGLEIRHWIAVESGMTVQVKPPGGRLIYLAEPAIKKRIKMANLDSAIFAKTNVSIADVPAISYMKVRGIMEPTGLRLGPEDLNVPGQRFEGSVSGNRIEGVFTIEHPRHEGVGAPPFPPDFGGDPALAPFLAPEDLIDSDDSVLIEHARKVTPGIEGLLGSGPAALSRWVAKNIEYAIPGGGGAAQDLRHPGRRVRRPLALLAASAAVWGSRRGWSGAACTSRTRAAPSGSTHGTRSTWERPDGSRRFDRRRTRIRGLRAHPGGRSTSHFATAVNMKEMEILEHRLRSASADYGGRSTGRPGVHSASMPGPVAREGRSRR